MFFTPCPRDKNASVTETATKSEHIHHPCTKILSPWKLAQTFAKLGHRLIITCENQLIYALFESTSTIMDRVYCEWEKGRNTADASLFFSSLGQYILDFGTCMRF
jgi:hypothetical protein